MSRRLSALTSSGVPMTKSEEGTFPWIEQSAPSSCFAFAMSVRSKIQWTAPFGNSFTRSKTGVVATLGEETDQEPLVDEGVDDPPQLRPVEREELLLRHPAVGSLVKREPHDEASRREWRAKEGRDGQLRDHVQRTEQLARLPEHVGHDPSCPPQGVTQGVKGGFRESTRRHGGIAVGRSLEHLGSSDLLVACMLLSGIEQPLQHGLNVGPAQRGELHGEDLGDVGERFEPGKRRKDPVDPR